MQSILQPVHHQARSHGQDEVARRHRRAPLHPAALRRHATAPRAGSDTNPVQWGGSSTRRYLEDGPIGYTPRPANLSGVRSAYAIYMVGDSMELLRCMNRVGYCT